MTDEERIAYLAGDLEQPPSLSDADRAELDELRAVLGDAAMWVEPDSSLEDRVVAAVAAAAEGDRDASTHPAVPHPRRRRWIPYSILGVAAAALLAIGLAVGLGGNDHPAEQYTGRCGVRAWIRRPAARRP